MMIFSNFPVQMLLQLLPKVLKIGILLQCGLKIMRRQRPKMITIKATS